MEDAGKAFRLLDLPGQALRDVLRNLEQSDLASLCRVSQACRHAAAAQLYRHVRHHFDEDLMGSGVKYDYLAAILETLAASDYCYAQHIKYITMTTSMAPVSAERLCCEYNFASSAGKFLNTLLVSVLKKTRMLEIFNWNIRMELSPAVYRTLHSLSTLRDVQIRLQSGPPLHTATRSGVLWDLTPSASPHTGGHNIMVTHPPPPPQANTLFGAPGSYYPHGHHSGQTKKLRIYQRSSLDEPGSEGSFATFQHLKHLSVLDMDSLDYVDDLAKCIQGVASTLKTLKLSFSERLSMKARVKTTGNSSDDDTVSEEDVVVDDIFIGPPGHNLHSQANADGPIPPEVRKERNAQEKVLERILRLKKPASEEAAVSLAEELVSWADNKYISQLTIKARDQTDQRFMQTVRDNLRRLSRQMASGSDVDKNRALKKSFDKIAQAANKYLARVKASDSMTEDNGARAAPKLSDVLPPFDFDYGPTPEEEELFQSILGTSKYSVTSTTNNAHNFPMSANHPLITLAKTLPPGSDDIQNSPFFKAFSGQYITGSPGPPQSLMPPGSGPSGYTHPHLHSSGHVSGVGKTWPGPPKTAKKKPKPSTSAPKTFKKPPMSPHGQDSPGLDIVSTQNPKADAVLHQKYDDDIDMEHPDVATDEDDVANLVTDEDDQTMDEDISGQVLVKDELEENHEALDGVNPSSLDDIPTSPLLDQESKGKEAVRETADIPANKPSRDVVYEYLRQNYGLQLEALYLHLIPVKPSVLCHAIDFTSLRHITLLNVGPQRALWITLAKLQESTPLALRSFHVDDVTTEFLELVNSLKSVVQLVLFQARSSRAAPSTHGKNKVSITEIRRLALKKHVHSLERVSITNAGSLDWELDSATIKLILKYGKKLQELSVQMGSIHQNFLQDIRRMTSLRLYHLHFVGPDASGAVLREIRRTTISIIAQHQDEVKYLRWLGFTQAGKNGLIHEHVLHLVPTPPRRRPSTPDILGIEPRRTAIAPGASNWLVTASDSSPSSCSASEDSDASSIANSIWADSTSDDDRSDSTQLGSFKRLMALDYSKREAIDESGLRLWEHDTTLHRL